MLSGGFQGCLVTQRACDPPSGDINHALTIVQGSGMETVGDVMTSKKVFYAREDTTIDEGTEGTCIAVILAFQILEQVRIAEDELLLRVPLAAALEILVYNSITGLPVLDEDQKVVCSSPFSYTSAERAPSNALLACACISSSETHKHFVHTEFKA